LLFFLFSPHVEVLLVRQSLNLQSTSGRSTMNSRTKVRQSNPTHIREGNLHRRTGRKRLQLSKDPLYQIVVLPASPSIESTDFHPTIFQRRRALRLLLHGGTSLAP